MLALAASATLLYAFINAFGAWMVIRRKGWVAALFMTAAAVLVLGFGGLVFSFPMTCRILAAGLILASVASFLNAHIVLGNVVWRFHVIRALAGTAIYILALYALA